MLNNKIWGEMARAFENSEGPLAERLVEALEAAENAGGDHQNPLKELRRILKVHRAYEHMNKGDLAIEHNDMNLAMQEYSAAEDLFPDNAEMKFWKAVTLVNIGKFEEALPIFKKVFIMNNNWVLLTPRLIESDLLDVTDEQLKKIISQSD